MLRAVRLLLAALLISAGCSGAPAPAGPGGPGNPGGGNAAAAETEPRRTTITVVGTSDLHGHISMLPYLGGSLANLKQAGTADALVLLDAGDMFQGTLESNLNEGASVIAAYNLLGYTAVAVGNHEYDFGPAGEAVVAAGPDEDPRGALKQRAAEARFPMLTANVLDEATGERVSWPNLHPSVVVERAGVTIGIIGITTIDTPRTTLSRNFVGLTMAPLVASVAEQAAALRARGAHLVLVTAHAGGRCKSFGDPDDLSSCEPDQEIFQVAAALPEGSVDAIVAGHTHQAVAHEVSGIPIVQSYAKGIAFGRIDLVLDEERRVVERRIHPPRFLCGERREPPDFEGGEQCDAGEYEGRPVEPDPGLAELAERYRASARAVRQRKLGVQVAYPVLRGHTTESPLGNLFADLMRAAWKGADVAITNGGGLRADLPAGELTYGALYEVMPFDNRFATVKLTGAQLSRLLARNLAGSHGVFSVSGVRVVARCQRGELVVKLTRDDGKRRIRDRERLTLVTSDFLASGGDGMLADLDLAPGAVVLHDGGPTIRDEVAAVLARRKGPLRGDDPHLFHPSAPRLDYPGKRPVRCE